KEIEKENTPKKYRYQFLELTEEGRNIKSFATIEAYRKRLKDKRDLEFELLKNNAAIARFQRRLGIYLGVLGTVVGIILGVLTYQYQQNMLEISKMKDIQSKKMSQLRVSKTTNSGNQSNHIFYPIVGYCLHPFLSAYCICRLLLQVPSL